MTAVDPPLGHPRLVKLVRDRVSGLLPDSTVSYERIADREVYIDALRKKLVEEAVEYLLDPGVGELADVYEAIRALAICDLGTTMQRVEYEALDKRRERGGFVNAIGMWCRSSAGPRHEGEHSAMPGEPTTSYVQDPTSNDGDED